MRRFRTEIIVVLAILMVLAVIFLGNVLGYIFTTKENVNQQIWGLLLISFSVIFFIFVMVVNRFTIHHAKQIEAASRVANELVKGNYKVRTYETEQNQEGELNHSLNVLARNLQEMTTQYEMQQDRLRTLIENMGSGLALLDEKGYIHLVNKTFLEIIHRQENDFIHKLYYEAFEHEDFIKTVEEIFLTETSIRQQLHISLDIERRHVEVYGSPIIGINEEWKGVVLVIRDITELKMLEEMRKDFVANVSHELKTPITSIKGFSETLLEGAMEDKELLIQFLSIILKESDRMQSLIKDLIDLSKMEQDAFQINVALTFLYDVVKDVLLVLENKAKEKNIELTTNIEERKMVSLTADAYRLKQILINLINNAIIYTPAGGKVDVTINDYSSFVEIAVADTGIGMSKKEVPRIFERFYRIDKARSRNSGGTGLGLAIVKHLVEAHEGTIEVKSEEGKGTTFLIRIPKNVK